MVYQKKKDSLAKYQYEPVLTYMKDTLGEEEKKVKEPFEEAIKKNGEEISIYDALGRPVFGKPSK